MLSKDYFKSDHKMDLYPAMYVPESVIPGSRLAYVE